MSCSNNTNSQEQSNRIKELENRLQKLESINSNTEEVDTQNIFNKYAEGNIQIEEICVSSMFGDDKSVKPNQFSWTANSNLFSNISEIYIDDESAIGTSLSTTYNKWSNYTNGRIKIEKNYGEMTRREIENVYGTDDDITFEADIIDFEYNDGILILSISNPFSPTKSIRYDHDQRTVICITPYENDVITSNDVSDGYEGADRTGYERVHEVKLEIGSLAHIKQEFEDNSITQEGEFFIDSDGDAFKWNGTDYEWVQYRDQHTRKDIANVRWKRPYTLFDLTTDEPIFPVNVDGILIYKIYYTSNENPSPKYGEFTLSQLENHLYYKFKNEENCITFLNGGAEKKDVAQEKRKEGEGRYKVRSKFPIIESIKDYKCSWCNEEFELIDAFKQPIGTYSSSDIYRLKNDEYQMNELEDLLELIQNEDESADGMNYTYSISFTSHFYCSRRCATNR
ncbi:hypothetical protein DUZ96_04445 [Winogradskyella sp. KYW1333]|nr:hypothetical protein DUZ96_04445 [Winogradskyella sp. KYW1333]